MLLSFLQPKARADEFQCETETVNLFSCVSEVALKLDLNTCPQGRRQGGANGAVARPIVEETIILKR